MPTVECENCGEEIHKPPSKVERAEKHFCSCECRKKRLVIECDQCGKKMERPSSLIHENNFCCRKCYFKWQEGKSFSPETQFEKGHTPWNKGIQREDISGDSHWKWKGGKIEVECDTCGKTTKVDKYKLDKQDRFFCSRECQLAYLHRSIRGKNNYNWEGGYEPYYGPNWRSQRRKTLERDSHTCQLCGAKEDGREHDVHHIVPFREFGQENYQEANKLSNLITLCNSCHRRIENFGVRPQFAIQEKNNV